MTPITITLGYKLGYLEAMLENAQNVYNRRVNKLGEDHFLTLEQEQYVKGLQDAFDLFNSNQDTQGEGS